MKGVSVHTRFTWPKFKFGLMLFLATFANSAFSLNCAEVSLLIKQYNKFHYSQKTFDDQVSKRALKNFLTAWDPGKIYFLESDVQELQKKYETKLDDFIAKKDCTAIDSIVNLFGKRFNERYKDLPKLLKLKHDFTVDEHMIIDRKALPWAKTKAELYDRWRRRIKYQVQQLKESVDEKKIYEKLKKRYDLAKKRQLELDSVDLYGSFINAFSNSLDPHSSYLPPANLEDFRIRSRLSLEGIGAMLRSEDGFTKIQSLVPGGAAFKTGKVKEEDKIVAVAQGKGVPVDVIDMDLREVVKLIRGKKGTEVRLTIMRETKDGPGKLVIPIIREKVELKDAAAKSDIYEVSATTKSKKKQKHKIGVIDLPSFYMDFQARHQGRKDYRSASRDMIAEVEKLKKKGIHALIVDLRSNGGGSLDEAIKVAGIFFDEGPVVQTKGFGDRVYVQSDRDGKTYYDGPLVVLIDRQSASASEIFAGAIRDYNRGVVVGDSHTFGKGTVQTLNDDLESLGAIKVTISKFYTPSGSSTQKNGVSSHIVLPSMMDQYEVGEKFYDYALAWEKIPEAKHTDFKQVAQYLPTLKAANTLRMKTNDDFKEIFEAIKEYQEKKNDRMKVSLKDEPKKKDEKKDEKKEAKDEDQAVAEGASDLQNDIYLQEAIRIATDYSRLLGKKGLAKLEIAELVKSKKAAKIAKDAKEEQKEKSEVDTPGEIKTKTKELIK